MSTVTKKELANRIAENTDTNRVVVKPVIQGNRLEFRDFGVFETVRRAERMAQNPKTLEKVHVPAKQKVKFKMSRLMKQKLNGREMQEHG